MVYIIDVVFCVFPGGLTGAGNITQRDLQCDLSVDDEHLIRYDVLQHAVPPEWSVIGPQPPSRSLLGVAFNPSKGRIHNASYLSLLSGARVTPTLSAFVSIRISVR